MPQVSRKHFANRTPQRPLTHGSRSWWRIRLPTDQQSSFLRDRLEGAFIALYLAAGCPRDMALYMREGQQEDAEFYFSPCAARYARELVDHFRGYSCAPPPRRTLRLIQGAEIGG